MTTTILDLHGGRITGLAGCVFREDLPERKAQNMKNLAEQVILLGKLFPDLDASQVVELGTILQSHTPAETLPGCEGLVAVPKISALARLSGRVSDWPDYNQALAYVVSMLDGVNPAICTPSSKLDAEHVRLSRKTRLAYTALERLPGDYLVFPAQTGAAYADKSVQQARSRFERNEFGLCALTAGVIALTHPERLADHSALGIDCPGSEFCSAKSRGFDAALCWSAHDDGRACLDAYRVSTTRSGFGSATGFLVLPAYPA